MADPNSEEKYAQFLRSKMTAVISTISPAGQPMSATIYFEVDENFIFYFMTKKFTRKYENLEKNPEVALVIGTENEPATVQLQGRAEKILDPKEFDMRMNLLRKRFFKNDYVAPLFQLAPEKNDMVLYRITPSWIRWLDLRDENVSGNFVQIL